MTNRMPGIAAVLMLGCGGALASPIAGLFNTGVDGNGVQLVGAGVADPHWTVAGGGSAFTAPLSGFYVQEGQNGGSTLSRWINSNGLEGSQPTSYALTLQFDLNGFDAATASIAGRFAVDNCGAIKLNGTTGGTIANCDSLDSFGTFSNFAFNSGFLAGLNTITVEITNAVNTLSAGRVEFTGSDARPIAGGPPQVPEPGTLALFGLGLAGLGLTRRRKSRTTPLSWLAAGLVAASTCQVTHADPQNDNANGPDTPDMCANAPDAPGLAVGLERRCPPVRGSSGIARGDFNGDGIADLAIGVPNEDVLALDGRTVLADAGSVHIIYGTAASGLVASATGVPTNQLLRQPSFSADFGVDLAQTGDLFGASLASGDFNRDGFSDLAVGVPGEQVSTTTARGRVQIFPGSSSGLATSASLTLGPAIFSGVANPGVSHGATSLTWGDFNGDGFGDLAVAADFMPSNFVNGVTPSSGTVTIFFGSASGLTTTGSIQFFTDSVQPDASQQTPLVLSAGDFDRDGFFDLVGGSPKREIDGVILAGGVSVVYGSPSGPTLGREQRWHANVPNVPTDANLGDFFGAAVAVGDMNGDGYADLAIGVPFERVNTSNSAGAVIILYGSPSGLQAPASGALVSQLWTQASTANFGPVEGGDQFGAALASGDFNGDGIKDLAIGAPGEDLTPTDAGIVDVIYGTSAGLSVTTGTAPIAISQAAAGDAVEAGDKFGSTLSAWNFGRSTHADLAVGAPLEDVGTLVDAGAMFVFYGSAVGLKPSASSVQIWTQDSPGIGDAAEAGDQFGKAAY